MTLSARKLKRCKNPACAKPFSPQRLGQKVCSPSCAIAISENNLDTARKAIADIERREIKKRKEKLKSRSDHLKEAQAIFNQCIRERDKDLPCISCGRNHEGQYHAGHYRTVAASPELRFEPLNVNKQCAPCNNHKSGDIVNYRINLVRKIGIENVEWLEGPHEPLKLNIDEIKVLKDKFRAWLRELKAATENYGETA